MKINSIKKLPVAARNMFDAVFDTVISKGRNEIIATKVALETVKQCYKPIMTTKSVTLKQEYGSNASDNYIDVLLGKPEIDAHGELYTAGFWKTSPMSPLTGDMEHINYRKAQGLKVDHPEEWDSFAPIADKYYHKGEELWAKVELPSAHPFTPTFKKNWESGMYGASVETAFPEEAVEYNWINGKLIPHITSGSITGFTFTDDPALDTKTNKNE